MTAPKTPMDLFLDDLERCLQRHLGTQWDYSLDRSEDGIDISLRAWGDTFREEEPYDQYDTED